MRTWSLRERRLVEREALASRFQDLAMNQHGKLAILVGGGPAPGINSVIGAATIRAHLEGVDVLGLRDGFEWIMQGDIEHIRPLTVHDVSRMHFRGGSLIGTSRANPTKDPAHLSTAVESLERLGVTKLITIGGDDTAYSAMRLAEVAHGRVQVVHVPKTIDNDLDLPPYVNTFGFQTARHLGVEIVENLMVDALTTSRWYFVIAMGRKAGHLALGMGKAAGATLTLIPEEFGETIEMREIVDTLVAAIIKRGAEGRRDGVAVIAEGVVLNIDEKDLESLDDVERDDHGHVRIAEIDIGNILKNAVRKRLDEFGLKTTIVAKDVGYELRCADPIPHDMEYTRDLGYCAAKYLISGGSGAMVTMQAGQFVPVPFDTMLDPATGKTKVRLVDVDSTRYSIARRYMIRLRRDDFDQPEALASFAEQAGITVDEFVKEFEPIVHDERPPLII
jgi:6-phosphofructokinase 1